MYPSAVGHFARGKLDTHSYRNERNISTAFSTKTRSFPMLIIRPARLSPSMFVDKMIADANRTP